MDIDRLKAKYIISIKNRKFDEDTRAIYNEVRYFMNNRTSLCHNHKDFVCDECHKNFEIREESCICVCFACRKFPICSSCITHHIICENGKIS